jgi:hypothetical protein
MSPLINDYKLKKEDASPRVQIVLSEIIEILNNGGYQEKRYTAAPTASDPGFEGEVRNVITGSVFTVYKYQSGSWWKSDGTAASGWTQVT